MNVTKRLSNNSGSELISQSPVNMVNVMLENPHKPIVTLMKKNNQNLRKNIGNKKSHMVLYPNKI